MGLRGLRFDSRQAFRQVRVVFSEHRHSPSALRFPVATGTLGRALHRPLRRHIGLDLGEYDSLDGCHGRGRLLAPRPRGIFGQAPREPQE